MAENGATGVCGPSAPAHFKVSGLIERARGSLISPSLRPWRESQSASTALEINPSLLEGRKWSGDDIIA